MSVDRASLAVSTQQWPIVVLTYFGRPTNRQLEDHLEDIERRVLSRCDRFVQIIDQRGGSMDPVQRSLIASHQGRMKERYEKYCVGEVYVASPETRGAMVAIFWMAPPPYPYAFVETYAEALTWARARLDAKTGV